MMTVALVCLVSVLDRSAWVQAHSAEVSGCLREAYSLLVSNPLPHTLCLCECLCVRVCGLTEPGFDKNSVQQRAFFYHL